MYSSFYFFPNRYHQRLWDTSTPNSRVLKVLTRKSLCVTALFDEMTQFITMERWVENEASCGLKGVKIKKVGHDETKPYMVPGGTTEFVRQGLRERFGDYWVEQGKKLMFTELVVASTVD